MPESESRLIQSRHRLPPSAGSRPLSLFGAPNLPGIAALATEQFEVTDRMAAHGRLFFHIPGGIQPGQHQLDVVFANSTVQCPFKIVGPDKDKIKELEKIKKGAK
jgi:hypothetical protein